MKMRMRRLKIRLHHMREVLQEAQVQYTCRTDTHSQNTLDPCHVCSECVFVPEAETEGQKDTEHSRKVFKVTCGGVTGTLHKTRFASGWSE